MIADNFSVASTTTITIASARRRVIRESYGKAGADYIATQWSKSDDQRIERLTQEAYAKGYLKPSDFTGVAAKMVATVIKNERVTGKGCEG